MSKIAQYLNEHLVGETSGLASLRDEYSTDRSVLQITPELVVYPRVTNDIRKVARFTWQLAEKGHAIGLTTRGFGNDQTGGAIGSGIVLTPQSICEIFSILRPKISIKSPMCSRASLSRRYNRL